MNACPMVAACLRYQDNDPNQYVNVESTGTRSDPEADTLAAARTHTLPPERSELLYPGTETPPDLSGDGGMF